MRRFANKFDRLIHIESLQRIVMTLCLSKGVYCHYTLSNMMANTTQETCNASNTMAKIQRKEGNCEPHLTNSISNSCNNKNNSTKTIEANVMTHNINNTIYTRPDVSSIPFHSSIMPETISNVATTTTTTTTSSSSEKIKPLTEPLTETETATKASTTTSRVVFKSNSKGNGKIEFTEIDLIDELRRITNRAMYMGDVFRSISSDAKKLLIKKKMPLEEFLLRNSAYFTVYRTGRLGKENKRIKVMLMVAPTFLVPTHAEIIPPIFDTHTSDNAEANNATNTTLYTNNASIINNTSKVTQQKEKMEYAAADDDGGKVQTTFAADTQSVNAAHTVHTVDNNNNNNNNNSNSSNNVITPEDRIRGKQKLTLKERIETVLQYVPNNFTEFAELQIPRSVKEKCMNYPLSGAVSFFKKYPQYFEIADTDSTCGTFSVRRSEALQKRIASYVKNSSPQKESEND